MWPKLWQVVLCITISILIDEGYGLMCLRCDSRQVNGNCKIGGRSRLSTKRYQSCYGRKPRCYIKATVDESGTAHFKRGCTLKDICAENDGLEMEYCSTCTHKYCNTHSMVLDQEVEDYLKNKEVPKNRTITLKETTMKQAYSSPVTVSKNVSGTATETLSKTVLEVVPRILPKPVSGTVSNTMPKAVSNTVTVSVSQSVPTNVTEK